MTGLARRRRIGWGTVFIAVYALVFNVILSSILIASISPTAAAAAHELCISSDDGIAVRSDADKQHGKTTVRCPLCVGHHVSGALPPPPQPALAERLPLAAPAVFAFRQRIVAHARSFDHLSRGPPVLI
jgi:hypothetical protein